MTTTPEDDFERTLRRRMHTLYPLAESEDSPRAPRIDSAVLELQSSPWKWIVPAAAAAAVVAVVGLGALALRPDSGDNASLEAGHPTASQSQTSEWAKACFQQWAAPLPQDAAYVGLTKEQALQLAGQRGDQLVVVGAGARCASVSDDVARAHPVAVVFNSGDSTGALLPDAVVVLANSNVDARYMGWGLGD